MHIFIDAELDVIQIFFTTEVNIAVSFFMLATVLANQLLIVLVSRLATPCIGVSFGPIAMLMVYRLLLNLVEVVWVELKRSHLLPM